MDGFRSQRKVQTVWLDRYGRRADTYRMPRPQPERDPIMSLELQILEPETLPLPPSEEDLQIQLSNRVQLHFALDGDALLGLSGAFVDSLPLMAPGSLRAPHLETRDGWQVSGFRFTGVEHTSKGIAVEAQVLATRPVLGRRTDMFQVPYFQTPIRSPQPIGTLRWHFAPQTLELGETSIRRNEYAGFSYFYEWELDHAFHWVVDAGTWEVGGQPHGITLFSQHMAPIGGPLEATISGEMSYLSSETFEKGSSNSSDVFHDTANDPNERFVIPIQAQLRGAGGTLVDFQWNDQGVLIGFLPEPNYYRSLVEWRPEENGIGFVDGHYFPLTKGYRTSPKFILAARVEGLSRVQALNRWTDAHQHVARLWRDAIGVQEEEPSPGFGIDNCGAGGVHIGYGPADLLDKWQERFAWMEQNGFQTFYMAGIGHHRGHELPFEANLCQPYDYRVHERYGGPERFRQFCDAAHQHGVRIVMWLGVPSSFAPVSKEHPDWIIRYDSGAPWDGNYGVLNAMSFHRGFSEWLLDEARTLKELGLDVVFFDSYHNLWAMPVNYAQPDLRPQFPDLLAWQCDCAKLGLSCWVESFSPTALTSPGFWPQYGQTPELCLNTNFRVVIDDRAPGFHNEFKTGRLSPSLYFEMMANKAPVGLMVTDFDNDPFTGEVAMPEEIGAVNRAYNELRPSMKARTLHEDGSVQWRDPASDTGALFVWKGSATVPPGFVAEPIYGAHSPLAPGTHACAGMGAFRLRRA